MSDQIALTERIHAYTMAILSARQRLQAEGTQEAHEELRACEQAYRDYLVGLNGLPD